MKYILLIILVLIFSNCSNNSNKRNSDPSVLLSDHKVTFVESRSLRHGISSGTFGDVVLLDLHTGNKYYITDDNYYVANPSLNYSGNKIAFLSNREGTPLELKIKGISPPHEIYIYKIQNDSLHRFDRNITKLYPNIMTGSYRQMRWKSNDQSLFILGYNNLLYEVPITKDTLIVHYKNDYEQEVTRDFSYSKDNKYLFVIIDDRRNAKYYIKLIELNDNISTIIYETEKLLQAGSWNRDNRRLLFTDHRNIYEYDVIYQSIDTLFIGNDKQWISDCYYTRNDNIIFWLNEEYTIVQYDREFREYTPRELVKYFVETDNIRFLTNDGYDKNHLNASIK